MGDMEFSMPVDVQTYNKQGVDDLFTDLVRRLSISGVDAYVKDVLQDERVGVEAIQIRPGGRGISVITSETLGLVSAELVYVFLNQYIKPVVTAPELQYLFPLVPGDGQAAFGTLAMLLEESSKRVTNWQQLEINNMDRMIEMSGPLASFRPTDKVIRKAPVGSSEYRRLKVSMSGDSQFHQKVSAWASMIVPGILYAVLGVDASDQSRKRRLDREEESRAKRARDTAHSAAAAASATHQ